MHVDAKLPGFGGFLFHPVKSGRGLAKRLTGRYPHLRVLYMSGYTHNVIGQDGMPEEGISFVQKPFTVQLLSEKYARRWTAPIPQIKCTSPPLYRFPASETVLPVAADCLAASSISVTITFVSREDCPSGFSPPKTTARR